MECGFLGCLVLVAVIVIAALSIKSITTSLPTPPSIAGGINYKVVKNVLSPNELRDIDAISESVKWVSNRHAAYPTTDIPTGEVWDIDVLMCQKLRNVIIPQMCEMFDVKFQHMWLRDMFLVKYEEGAQTELKLHTDASDFSFVLHINPLREFEGGGTFFLKTNQTVRLTPGDCLIFSGKEQHSGVRITSGRRLIITGFVDLNSNPNLRRHLRRQYLMYNLRALVERKMFRGIGFHERRSQTV